MARDSLPTFDGPYSQFYSIVTTEGDVVLGQVRNISYQDQIETARVGRVGDSTKKTLLKTKNPTYQIDIWTDQDLYEVAVALNATATPGSGDTVKLDTTAGEITLKIKTYDGTGASAALQYTTYIQNAVPTQASQAWDEDGENVVSVTGECEDIYSVRA
jgi:hypothetical protein